MKLMAVTRMMMGMSFLTATDLVLHGKERVTALPVFLMLFATCSELNELIKLNRGMHSTLSSLLTH